MTRNGGSLTTRPQCGPVDLPCLCLWQFTDELDSTGIFVRSDRLLNEILDGARQILTALSGVAKHDESLDDLAAGRVGYANNRALTYVRMLENNLLDLWPEIL